MPRFAVAGVRGAALCVAASLLLAGCADSPAPRPLDRSAPSASSPSGSPTASPSGPPVMPAAAKGTSQRAAVAFVRYYVDVLNYALAGGDVEPLQRLAEASCDVCRVIAGSIAKVNRAGGSFSGSGWRLRSFQYLGFQPGNGIVINAVIRIAPQTVVSAKGEQPRQFDGGRVLYMFGLKPGRQGLRVMRLERAR